MTTPETHFTMKDFIHRNKVLLYSTIGGIAALVLIIAFAYLYDAGYRIHGWKIAKAGTVTVHLQDPETLIFLDGKFAHQSKTENESVRLSKISPGSHSIIVSKNDAWPWQKTISMSSGGELEIYPFTLYKELVRTPIQQNTAEYQTALRIFRTHTFKQATSTAGNLSVDANKILLSGDCPETSCTIMETPFAVNSISFWKDSDKQFVYATTGGIFVADLDTNETRNIQPLFTGENPTFYIESGTIYIRDDGRIYKIAL